MTATSSASFIALRGSETPSRGGSHRALSSLGLMGVLTPYASGPAPIWYSSGYIPTKDFWRLGATMGALYLAVLLALGLPFANQLPALTVR